MLPYYKIEHLLQVRSIEAEHLHARCFPNPWHDFHNIMEIKGVSGFSASDYNNLLIGFVLTRILFEQAEILTICVDPSFQHAGVGHKLMEYVHELCTQQSVESILLEVGITNHKAQKLYGKLGYEEIDRRPNYYHYPDNTHEDALIMQKKLYQK